ncbi:3-phosphoshikimate 1-carboxyvinyltransferase [Buchnera aphidicola]|uniref:3-phosphoshikimate 1-carboxyvinyltransferase n=1 Tax=Buchnera aphidicola TaxID=9 RepID=UPI0031B8AB9D
MYNKLVLNPISSINGNIYLPGSKSISNRVLLISAISNGTICIKNLLSSDDVNHMLQALKTLGIRYQFTDRTTCIVYGSGNKFNFSPETYLFLGNAGTAVRPLTAILSLQKSNVIITGDKRMKERPIQNLVDSLKQGGGKFRYLKNENYLPIKIKGGFIGGNIVIQGNISSQFLTSILIAAPLAQLNSKIVIQGELVSKPYIDMTLKIMQQFGIKIYHKNYKYFYINGNQKYQSPTEYIIEGDASSATYFLAAAAIKGPQVRVIGIDKNSIQGDIQFVSVLEKMGAKIIYGKNFIQCMKNVLTGIELDANHIPDAAMTIAMLALFANGRTIIKNIYNWRVKETNRLEAMSAELKKIGANVSIGKDFINITPPKKFLHAEIETYNDHRMAMCFSLIALSGQYVTILNPQCVSKTFPNYFSEFQKISTISYIK